MTTPYPSQVQLLCGLITFSDKFTFQVRQRGGSPRRWFANGQVPLPNTRLHNREAAGHQDLLLIDGELYAVKEVIQKLKDKTNEENTTDHKETTDQKEIAAGAALGEVQLT